MVISDNLDTLPPTLKSQLFYFTHHFGNATVSDADSDFGLLRLSLSIGHTDDVCVVGGLDITHGTCDCHVDFVHVSAVK